eukprot:TRINITY_DN12561_c0_g1_i1.p1 TRINITY_DN12561_c0_g1~~TRINITY_DN12561_c0_g1_i1.p1  ORF type:complete len:173 (+),score=33.71 TRINITY_DN12561_c0_g1_i1:327-845(+)
MVIYSMNFCGPEEYGLEDILHQFKKGIYKMFALIKDNSAAGFVIIATYAGKKAQHIEYLAVRSDCQGKGLGSLIIQHLVKILAVEPPSPKVLSLECEKKLVPFYQRLGFEDLGLKPKDWLMEKEGKPVSVPYHFLVRNLSPHASNSATPGLVLTRPLAKKLRHDLFSLFIKH